MGTGGCLTHHNTSNGSLSGTLQRFGEYRLQFTDYNGNQDDDAPFVLGDEDGYNGITGDDDDIELGNGPIVVVNPMSELYLINTLKKKRVLFRWNYKVDPNAPSGFICTMATGSGCLGNVQMLRLDGKDIGWNHDGVVG